MINTKMEESGGLFIRSRPPRRRRLSMPEMITNEGEYLEMANQMKEQYDKIQQDHKKSVRCLVNCVEDLQYALQSIQLEKLLHPIVRRAILILEEMEINPKTIDVDVETGVEVLQHMRRTGQWNTSLPEWLLVTVFRIEVMRTRAHFRFCSLVRERIWNVMRDLVIQPIDTFNYRPQEQRDDDAPTDPLYFNSRGIYMSE